MTYRAITLGSLSLVMAMGLLAGCNSQDARNLGQDTAHLARDTGQALEGATLDGKVRAVLALRKGVDMSNLQIEAKDGVVTLHGHVRDKAEKERVRATVDGIRGVDSVNVDDLHVQP
jgi:osmotically-inducible protein OsmY